MKPVHYNSSAGDHLHCKLYKANKLCYVIVQDTTPKQTFQCCLNRSPCNNSIILELLKARKSMLVKTKNGRLWFKGTFGLLIKHTINKIFVKYEISYTLVKNIKTNIGWTKALIILDFPRRIYVLSSKENSLSHKTDTIEALAKPDTMASENNICLEVFA